MTWREAAQARYTKVGKSKATAPYVIIDSLHDLPRALALLAEAEDIAARVVICAEPFVQSPGLPAAARAFLAALRTEEPG